MAKGLKYLLLLLLILGCSGKNDCTSRDGTPGVELWDVCYSIENTTRLYLYGNQLNSSIYIFPTGEIPPEIGNLTNLTYLNLGNNQLTGSIPSEIGNLTNLDYLNLASNQLTGSIPPEIGSLTNLTNLILSSNQLSGEIPSEIGNLTNLTGLWLGDNQLSGEIPSEIGNLFQELTGSIMTEKYARYLPKANLWLQNNQLTGEIPQEVCDLIERNMPSWWKIEDYILDGNNLINTCE